ncbi:MAG: hypothetical protein EXS10_10540 [Phycisphaerales bacterium]|nr:hypothetical protein [Phycisphaerales bacterium]
MLSSVTVRAPAKINLALSVGPPGPDRMHPIASWMVTTNLCDDLHLARLPAGTPSRFAILWHSDAPRRSAIDWPISKDLAARAHLALERRLNRALPVQLRMEKRIPVGGGLGGGSSDAAAMLRGLVQLFALDISNAQLKDIAHSLGSDVPFLLDGGSALVEGLGERITTAALPSMHLVLVFPDAVCKTSEVYAKFDGLRADARVDTARVRALLTQQLAPHAPFNDLAPAAMQCAPTLLDDAEEVARIAERAVHVSGSGSTLFVIADEEMHAQALADSVTRALALPARAVQLALAPATEHA